VLGVLLAAAFLVSCGSTASSSGSDPASSGEGDAPNEDTSVAGVEELGPPALGDPDSPVVMVEYGDYQ
jgi:hypothetical protein